MTGEANGNQFQYTGRENDGTGLYYYRARYYSPDMSRFISEDPIGFAGGDVNLQAYVGGNPISLVDPLGLAPNPNGIVPADHGRRPGPGNYLALFLDLRTRRAAAERFVRGFPLKVREALLAPKDTGKRKRLLVPGSGSINGETPFLRKRLTLAAGTVLRFPLGLGRWAR